MAQLEAQGSPTSIVAGRYLTRQTNHASVMEMLQDVEPLQ